MDSATATMALESAPVGAPRPQTPVAAGEVTVATEPVTSHIASLITTSLRTVNDNQELAEGSVVGPIEEPHPATRNDWTEPTDSAARSTALTSPTVVERCLQAAVPNCTFSPAFVQDFTIPGLLTGGTPREPPKKRVKSAKQQQPTNVEVSLEGKDLWEEFYRRGTEMIVNRAGRRMFPGFAVSISGLKPKVKYTMRVEVVLADNHRFKFLNARWLAVGTAEPQCLSKSYVHPDSPNSGAFWMRHGVSFRKLKITNNKERPGNNALLHSMHKYYLRLVVEEERKTPPGEERLPAKTVLSMDFTETTFVAVTAYQNEEVTQLKITNNPFAKAFRENAADMDWETAQMLYGTFSPLSHGDHFGSHSVNVAPGSWPLHSPFRPPTVSAFSTLSPLPGSAYLSPSQYDHIPGQYFQWPPSRQYDYTVHKSHPYPHPPVSSDLPDFESVFTMGTSSTHS